MTYIPVVEPEWVAKLDKQEHIDSFRQSLESGNRMAEEAMRKGAEDLKKYEVNK